MPFLEVAQLSYHCAKPGRPKAILAGQFKLTTFYIYLNSIISDLGFCQVGLRANEIKQIWLKQMNKEI